MVKGCTSCRSAWPRAQCSVEYNTLCHQAIICIARPGLVQLVPSSAWAACRHCRACAAVGRRSGSNEMHAAIKSTTACGQ